MRKRGPRADGIPEETPKMPVLFYLVVLGMFKLGTAALVGLLAFAVKAML